MGQAIEETDENAPEPEEEPVKKEEPVEEVRAVLACYITSYILAPSLENLSTKFPTRSDTNRAV